MTTTMLIVTSANSGGEACSNAEQFMLDYENFIDYYEMHGAISTDDETFINPDYEDENVFDGKIKCFDDMKSYSLGIAKQDLIYSNMFESVRRGGEELGWFEWYGASKYCSLQAELGTQSLNNPEEFNLLEHELFPVDFSLHQIVHYSYNKDSEDEKTWIVHVDTNN
jgi:hypothetical protein